MHSLQTQLQREIDQARRLFNGLNDEDSRQAIRRHVADLEARLGRSDDARGQLDAA